MENLDVSGYFWLASDSRRKVAGRLVFDINNGANLSLIGSIRYPPESEWVPNSPDATTWLEMDSTPARILGEAEQKIFTLDNCLLTKRQSNFTTVTKEEYQPSLILSGAHFDEEEEVEFSGVRFKISNLEHWANAPRLVVDYPTSKDEHEKSSQVHVRYASLTESKKVTEAENLTMSLGYSLKISDVSTKVTIVPDCSFRIERKKLLNINGYLGLCSAIRNLLTICIDMPSPLSSISFQHPGLVRQNSDNRSVPIPVTLYAKLPWNQVESADRVIHPGTIVFTLRDLGGIGFFDNWLEVAGRFKVVIDNLVTLRNTSTIYAENRFFNSITAAESLVRIRRNKQHFDFKSAIKGLAREAGVPFANLVGDIKAWADRVADARVNYVVHTGLRGSADSISLYWLSESIYFLVVLCLFRECGISDDVLEKVQLNERFQHVGNQVRSVSWPLAK